MSRESGFYPSHFLAQSEKWIEHKFLRFPSIFDDFFMLIIFVHIPRDDGDDGGVWNVNPSAFISLIICSVAGGNW